MSVTREEIAAFADGELEGVRLEEVRAAVEADPALATEVAAHRALKAKLGAHFTPIAEEPVPERFAAMLRPAEAEPAPVVDFADAREKREARRLAIPRWGWVAGPALAASLALAVVLQPFGSDRDYAGGSLEAALEGQLVAAQSAEDDYRILLSFRGEGGQYCRAFSGPETGGIACRDDSGWNVVERLGGSAAQGTEYRQASSAGDIMAAAQDMAAGPALTAEQEAEAMERGWR